MNKDIARYIDHTILSQNCTLGEIENLCSEARIYKFASVCVPPYFVKNAARILSKDFVKVATVVGFPMGYSTTPSKVEEVKRAIDDGADEIDVVANVCAIKDENWGYVRNDIDSMTRAAHLRGKVIKVIFEMDALKEQEILQLCQICLDCDVNYVKTSTGFNNSQTSVAAVKLLKAQLGNAVKIKASGGIKTRAFAQALLLAGASRLGCSASLQIIQE